MQFGQLQRREFITLLGGSAAMWPLAAHAQQPAKLPTIGFLGPTTPAAMSNFVASFVGRLGELGWVDGRTVAIDYRYTGGRNEQAAEIAIELVGRKGRRHRNGRPPSCARHKTSDFRYSDRFCAGT